MNAQQFKQINLDYRKRLIYFARQIVQDDFWGEIFADEALMHLWNVNYDFKNDAEVKNFLYSVTRDACFQYLDAYGKTLSMEQVKFIFFDAEILNELGKNNFYERTEK